MLYLTNMANRILHKPIAFPNPVPPQNTSIVSAHAQDLILGLCTIDRSHRLGNISGGAQRVKSHPFFNGVVWDDIYARKYLGPIIPKLKSMDDATCFDNYPDDTGERDVYTDEARREWDKYFEDF
jgi:protein kinase A